MKLRYYGHACFSLAFEGGPTLAIDPFDESVSYPPCDVACDAALVTHDHFDHNHVQSLRGDFRVVREAGEYEIGGVRVRAIPSFHDKAGGALRGQNLIFRIEGEGLCIAHLGDLGHMPDAAQAEFLQGVDLMLVPIGGTYTIDTPEAEALIRALKPRRCVAMHYRTEAYDCDMSTCDDFARDMGAQAMPREIEISAQTLEQLPEVMILNYK